jgi:hypothetical protein
MCFPGGMIWEIFPTPSAANQHKCDLSRHVRRIRVRPYAGALPVPPSYAHQGQRDPDLRPLLCIHRSNDWSDVPDLRPAIRPRSTSPIRATPLPPLSLEIVRLRASTKFRELQRRARGRDRAAQIRSNVSRELVRRATRRSRAKRRRRFPCGPGCACSLAWGPPAESVARTKHR